MKTRFSVVDPVEEAFQAKLANKKQRYNLLRHDGRTDQKDDSQMPSDTLIVKEKETKVVSPLPPPLVSNYLFLLFIFMSLKQITEEPRLQLLFYFL